MISLTPKQARCKRAISDHIAQTGETPTYEELRQRLALVSRGSAFNMVDELVVRGHAVRLKRATRQIRLLNEPVSRAPDGAPLYFVPVEAS